jgi:hypothetical protein
MKYLITLWKSERGFCPCEETMILLHFDPARIAPPVDESLWGRIVHAWKTKVKS